MYGQYGWAKWHNPQNSEKKCLTYLSQRIESELMGLNAYNDSNDKTESTEFDAQNLHNVRNAQKAASRRIGKIVWI